MEDLLSIIARVKRSMPRNADVMAVCDALEARLVSKPVNTVLADVSSAVNNGKQDRKAYMREYMRKRRANPFAT